MPKQVQLEIENPSQIITVGPEVSLERASQEMVRHRVGTLVVVEGERHIVGIISERDIVGALGQYAHNAAQVQVREVMTCDVITQNASAPPSEIFGTMEESGIRHIVLLKHGKAVGVKSLRELHADFRKAVDEATTDELTGLVNRRQLLRSLDLEFERFNRLGHDISLAVMDIDHFKRVNDRYGHDAGDEVLRNVASELHRQCRTVDTVGRIGGEEFALVLPWTNITQAELVCERIRDRIESLSTKTTTAEIRVTVSIGVANVTKNTTDPTNLLRQADTLMYAAKSAGRNRVISDNPSVERNTPHELAV